MIIFLKKISAILLFSSVFISVLSTSFRYFDKWTILDKQLSSGVYYDLQIQFYSVYFLLGIFFVSNENKNIKLDLFTSNDTKGYKIFLQFLKIVFSSVIGYYSLLYFLNSIHYGVEQSTQPGGLPVSHLKLFLFVTMLGFFAISVNMKRI